MGFSLMDVGVAFFMFCLGLVRGRPFSAATPLVSIKPQQKQTFFAKMISLVGIVRETEQIDKESSEKVIQAKTEVKSLQQKQQKATPFWKLKIKHIFKALLEILPLVIIGISRLIFSKLLNYQVFFLFFSLFSFSFRFLFKFLFFISLFFVFIKFYLLFYFHAFKKIKASFDWIRNTLELFLNIGCSEVSFCYFWYSFLMLFVVVVLTIFILFTYLFFRNITTVFSCWWDYIFCFSRIHPAG